MNTIQSLAGNFKPLDMTIALKQQAGVDFDELCELRGLEFLNPVEAKNAYIDYEMLKIDTPWDATLAGFLNSGDKEYEAVLQAELNKEYV